MFWKGQIDPQERYDGSSLQDLSEQRKKAWASLAQCLRTGSLRWREFLNSNDALLHGIWENLK